MTHEDPTIDLPKKPNFESTQWSLVLAAQHRSDPSGREAFAHLCETYWLPLYAFVRQKVNDPHHAQDLVQSYFQRAMEKNYVADADPDRGRFRTFLLSSISHFMANEWDRQSAKKRGGGRQFVSIDFRQGEQLLDQSIVSGETAEKQFERTWALSLLSRVLQLLEAEYESSDKAVLWARLLPFLTPNTNSSYATTAQELEMTVGAVRVAVHRLRSRYRDLVRAEIRNTISDPEDVDDEVRRLFEAFSS